MKTELTFNLGNQEITASYDDWEELYEKLEFIFGVNAVEDKNYDPEKLDKLDLEISFDNDINEN